MLLVTGGEKEQCNLCGEKTLCVRKESVASCCFGNQNFGTMQSAGSESLKVPKEKRMSAVFIQSALCSN